MKKSFTLFCLCIVFCIGKTSAQSFSPITLTGYNWDAVAEATTALATTTGPLDGSNYVLYSAAYGSIYSVSTGLPNNGLITSGTYTYQLATYTANNMCLTTPTVTIDSLTFATPAAYSGLSLLCFSTEGNGSMNVTVRFTDNTTQTYTNQALTDWFGTGTAIISGFDRVNRSGTTPANASGNPKMFAIDLPINCTNRAKLVKNIKFQNVTTSTQRNCVMAISGAAMPTYTVSTNPVTCNNGTNGSATITALGGIAPYTYTWSTTPAQTGPAASSLPVGSYNIISQDGGLCPVTITANITLSLAPQPSLNVTANAGTVCAGTAVLITASGSSSYTWNTTANTSTISVAPQTTGVYTVGGLTNFNCYRTGSISIFVNPLPIITFTTPATICVNGAQVPLGATPAGGNYAGSGITFNTFYPNFAGVGTKTVSYTYSDAFGCVGVAVNTIIVNALPPVTFTLSANSLCTNSSTMTLAGTPSNGTFAGTGVSGSVYTPSVAGAGTQTVTYSFTDANNCTAIVTSSVMINTVPSVSISTTKKSFCIFTPTLYLNAQPSGGVFTGAGTSTAGVFSPTLAGVGSHTVIYAYTDANGCVGKTAYTATVSSCNGIGENAANANGYIIYPNPNNGSFTIKASSDVALSLMNELGQLIRTFKLDESNSHEFLVTDLPGGVYFVAGQNDSQLIKQKIVVTK